MDIWIVNRGMLVYPNPVQISKEEWDENIFQVSLNGISVTVSRGKILVGINHGGFETKEKADYFANFFESVLMLAECNAMRGH